MDVSAKPPLLFALIAHPSHRPRGERGLSQRGRIRPSPLLHADRVRSLVSLPIVVPGRRQKDGWIGLSSMSTTAVLLDRNASIIVAKHAAMY